MNALAEGSRGGCRVLPPTRRIGIRAAYEIIGGRSRLVLAAARRRSPVRSDLDVMMGAGVVEILRLTTASRDLPALLVSDVRRNLTCSASTRRYSDRRSA
jgi:hypothetical protein